MRALNLSATGSHLVVVASVGACLVALAAPAQAAERTLHDKRGDVQISDLVATKLMNNKDRLIVRTRFVKGSMAGRDAVATILRSNHRPVKFIVAIGWNNKRHTLRSFVQRMPLEHPKAGRSITKRCDLRLHRNRNIIRFSVDSDRCFRKAAGPMRFGTATERSMDRAPQKRWVTKRAVKRG